MLAQVEPEFVANRSLKDPAKIAADLAEKRANWKERAALSPVTGRVIAIGILVGNGAREIILHGKPEPDLLREFWVAAGDPHPWVGFGIFHFDLPFLIRRSWKYGIPVPPGTRDRYWHSKYIDLRDIWQLGDRDFGGGLDLACRFLGLGGKTGSGADFAKLYEENQEAAISYLRNDLYLTLHLARTLRPD